MTTKITNPSVWRQWFATMAMLCAAVVLFFASCGKDDLPMLSVSSSEAITFSAAATESHEITVTTNQASWDAVSDQPWCVVTKGSGKFTVTATPNTTITAPTPAMIIVFTCCSNTEIINVKQLPVIIPLTKVHISKGTFLMGSPVREPNRRSNETQHRVTLTKDFYMSKYEITNAQYAAFLNANAIGSDGKWAEGPDPTQVLIVATVKSYSWDLLLHWGLYWDTNKWEPVPGKDNFPVINVTWYGATAFAGWVGGSLPTEAQWEYACRGGLAEKPFGVDDGTKLYADQANCKESTLGHTTVVGSYAPNAFGLYDMHGNVAEWCSDWYGDYDATAVSDPTGPAISPGFGCVLRGGSWYYSADYCRSAYRVGVGPFIASDAIGFRVVYVP